ncbi:MAG: DUF6029 family protein [Bacteroidia bacterium]
MLKKIALTLPLLVSGFIISAQENQQQTPDFGELHGNFQVDAQYYNPDSAIGAPEVPEKMRMNAFGNLLYTRGRFTAGARIETYLNALQGFDQRYKGVGIPYRFITYDYKGLEITAGNFYEQFGSGMILRAYEERGLGYDNVFDGIRIKYTILKGLTIKGMVGLQRTFFDRGPGIVRAFDGEININELFKKIADSKAKLILGGSFVSKYQQDQDPVYKLPENVGAWSARLNFIYGKFNLSGEYAYKINDPSSTNKFIYKHGSGLLVTAAWSTKGLGLIVSAKRIDNMDFRSDRTATGNNLQINYLPALTRQHTYNLPATIYPYATQPNGEMALQAELTYTIKKETKLGGKYGTVITVNYSTVNGLDTTTLNNGLGYESKFLSTNGQAYFRDFNIEVSRKLSKKVKLILQYLNLVYNKDVVQGLSGYGTVYADMGIVDVTYKFNQKYALRMELQSLTTRQDEGSWAMGLLEFTHSKYFVAVMNQYNYGNKHPEKRLHYPNITIGYLMDKVRITATYGRQRAGIFCVGGVCRNVPASNGLTLSVMMSF